MPLSRLRWISVSLPVLGIVVLEFTEDFILEPVLGRWAAHIIAFSLVALGASTLSFVVFRAFSKIEDRLRRQNQELTAMNETSQVVSSGLKIDEISRLALQKILEISGSEAGEIILLDPETSTLETYICTELVNEKVENLEPALIDACIPGLVARTGEPIVVTDLQYDRRFKRKRILDMGFVSMASIPLRAKDQLIGVLDVFDRHNSFTEDVVGLLTVISSQIALAIENGRLYSRLADTLSHLTAVIESSGDAIITTDLTGRIKTWNHGAEHIYGWKREEVLDTRLPMVPEQLLDDASVLMVRLNNGETIRSYETRRRHKSGEGIDVVVAASPVRDTTGEIVALVGISRDVSERRRLQDEISRQKQSVAILEERERIAREMHDGLAQVLGYVNTKVQAVKRLIQIGKHDVAQTHLIQLEHAARQVYADVREAIFGLHISATHDRTLSQVLEEYLIQFEEQFQIVTKLEIQEPALLNEFALPVEIQLIRIIQEALTNVRKHANAKNVCIAFDRDGSQARIAITDDGTGFDESNTPASGWPRFGLLSMRERAEGVEGMLEIRSIRDSGTCISVTLPLSQFQPTKDVP